MEDGSGGSSSARVLATRTSSANSSSQHAAAADAVARRTTAAAKSSDSNSSPMHQRQYRAPPRHKKQQPRRRRAVAEEEEEAEIEESSDDDDDSASSGSSGSSDDSSSGGDTSSIEESGEDEDGLEVLEEEEEDEPQAAAAAAASSSASASAAASVSASAATPLPSAPHPGELALAEVLGFERVPLSSATLLHSLRTAYAYCLPMLPLIQRYIISLQLQDASKRDALRAAGSFPLHSPPYHAWCCASQAKTYSTLYACAQCPDQKPAQMEHILMHIVRKHGSREQKETVTTARKESAAHKEREKKKEKREKKRKRRERREETERDREGDRSRSRSPNRSRSRSGSRSRSEGGAAEAKRRSRRRSSSSSKGRRGRPVARTHSGSALDSAPASSASAASAAAAASSSASVSPSPVAAASTFAISAAAAAGSGSSGGGRSGSGAAARRSVRPRSIPSAFAASDFSANSRTNPALSDQLKRMILDKCKRMLEELRSRRRKVGWIFNNPINYLHRDQPDFEPKYAEFLEKYKLQPMDLSTVRDKLYASPCAYAEDLITEFREDVLRVYSNARRFNPPDHWVHQAATEALAWFKERIEKLESWLEGKLVTTGQKVRAQEGEEEEEEEQEDGEREQYEEEHGDEEEEAEEVQQPPSQQDELMEERTANLAAEERKVAGHCDDDEDDVIEITKEEQNDSSDAVAAAALVSPVASAAVAHAAEVPAAALSDFHVKTESPDVWAVAASTMDERKDGEPSSASALPPTYPRPTATAAAAHSFSPPATALSTPLLKRSPSLDSSRSSPLQPYTTILPVATPAPAPTPAAATASLSPLAARVPASSNAAAVAAATMRAAAAAAAAAAASVAAVSSHHNADRSPIEPQDVSSSPPDAIAAAAVISPAAPTLGEPDAASSASGFLPIASAATLSASTSLLPSFDAFMQPFRLQLSDLEARNSYLAQLVATRDAEIASLRLENATLRRERDDANAERDSLALQLAHQEEQQKARIERAMVEFQRSLNQALNTPTAGTGGSSQQTQRRMSVSSSAAGSSSSSSSPLQLGLSPRHHAAARGLASPPTSPMRFSALTAAAAPAAAAAALSTPTKRTHALMQPLALDQPQLQPETLSPSRPAALRPCPMQVVEEEEERDEQPNKKARMGE